MKSGEVSSGPQQAVVVEHYQEVEVGCAVGDDPAVSAKEFAEMHGLGQNDEEVVLGALKAALLPFDFELMCGVS
jgi:hypothetical protein